MPRLRLLLLSLCLVTLSIAAHSPVAGVFDGCAAAGTGGDARLNQLKNRAGIVAAPRPLTVAALQHLPLPASFTRQRRTWTQAARAVVAPWEAMTVIVEGYLVGAKEQGLEASNCRRSNQHDDHLWLAAAAGATKAQSTVAEVTPRWRAANPAWTLRELNRLVAQGTHVRLTGWLLFDQDHPDQVGKTRATIWELHPITRIEVQRSGRWVELAPAPAINKATPRTKRR